MQTKQTKRKDDSEVGSLKRRMAMLMREVAAWRDHHDDEAYSPRHDMIVHKKTPIAEAMNDDGIG